MIYSSKTLEIEHISKNTPFIAVYFNNTTKDFETENFAVNSDQELIDELDLRACGRDLCEVYVEVPFSKDLIYIDGELKKKIKRKR